MYKNCHGILSAFYVGEDSAQGYCRGATLGMKTVGSLQSSAWSFHTTVWCVSQVWIVDFPLPTAETVGS